MKKRFLELLEQDAAQAHSAAQAWKDLEKNSGRLEDANGRTIAAAAEMAAKFIARENEIRAMIADIKALP